jgi:hypothetical protein
VFVDRDKFDLPTDQTTVGHLIELAGRTPVNQYELQQRKGKGSPELTALGQNPILSYSERALGQLLLNVLLIIRFVQAFSTGDASR